MIPLRRKTYLGSNPFWDGKSWSSKNGDLYVEKSCCDILIGDDLNFEGRGSAYLAVVDSKDRRRLVQDLASTITKVIANCEKSSRKFMIILQDWLVGDTAKKIFEYQLRKSGWKASFYVDPTTVDRKKKVKEASTRTIMV